MPRVALNSGAYSAKSVIASAQRCVNLYPEVTPQQTSPPTLVIHYLTPGLVEKANPTNGTVRGLYRATTGALFAVIDTDVYFINTNYTYVLCGTIGAGTGQVSMMDNGTTLVVVDGTANGYWLTLGTTVLNAIVDAAFYGANFVCYLDGYFIFNRPNTNQFYISPPFWNGVDPFDPLDIAAKIGGPDPIIAIAVVHRNLWLVGQLTTEVWYNGGGADFPFERQPGVFVDHGMLRGYSIAVADESIIWLGRDRQGQTVVFQNQDYAAVRISNHALENEMQQYAVVNDAIAFTYQQEGHTFYVLTFPTADKTWVYDLATQEWHERTWTDGDGVEHRIRPNCGAAAYNVIIVGDHENGKLYEYDLETYTDDGDPIVRRRGFPHLVKDGKRVSYLKFQADVQVGAFGGSPASQQMLLRWSDTRGATWGDTVPLALDFGTTGEYYQSPTVQRLGYARDRVFELYWSFPYPTALQGAWIEFEISET